MLFQDDEREELTLLSLPDVPLLHILSYLPIEDLVPAGMAFPRLGALTRTCMSLWRPPWTVESTKSTQKKIIGFWGLWPEQRIQDILGAVRVVPPVFKFSLSLRDVDRSFMIFGRNVSQLAAYIGIPPDSVVGAIRELVGPQIRCLVVHGVSALDVLFAGLQGAHCTGLETLQISVENPITSSAPWPQEVKLPRISKLHLFTFHMDSECMTSAAAIEDLKTLLRAHSEQLHEVSLDEHLIPVLFDSPVAGLRCLKVPSAWNQGLAAALAQTEGLKELHVSVGHHNDPLLTQVVEFLDSHPQCSQLERLVLLKAAPETLLALLPDRLAGVQHFEMCSLETLEDWENQLGALNILLEIRLSRLRSLTLRDVDLAFCQVFANLPSHHIPALELLLLSPSHTTLEDVEEESAMFIGLVSRAPKDLHTLLLAQDDRELRLCRHSESGSGECGLCEEAANILHDRYPSYTPIKVQHVQVTN